MKSAKAITIAFTLVLLAHFAGVALAQEVGTDEVSLTGQLSESSEGQYVLIDAESGDELSLRGSEEELAEHVGSSVTVTGRWASDDDGNAYFWVSSVGLSDA